MALRSGTREPIFEALYLQDSNIVLKILDNETILNTIDYCI